MEYHDARNPVAPACQKQAVFGLFLDFAPVAVNEPMLYFLDGARGDGYKTLLAAFPLYFDKALLEVEVGNLQVAELGYAQPRSCTAFRGWPLLRCPSLLLKSGVDYLVYLLHSQHLRQPESYF